MYRSVTGNDNKGNMFEYQTKDHIPYQFRSKVKLSKSRTRLTPVTSVWLFYATGFTF